MPAVDVVVHGNHACAMVMRRARDILSAALWTQFMEYLCCLSGDLCSTVCFEEMP